MTSTNTLQDTLRAGLYQRVSTTDQDHERQNDANREAAEAADWQATEYAEKLSASRYARGNGGTKRPQWNLLLADLAAGLIDVVVLWEPSRGDRQLTSWSQFLDTCREHGVLVHVTSHGRTYDPANPRDRRSLAEDGIDSEYETKKTRARIVDGKKLWLSKGHPAGGMHYGIHRVNDPDKQRNRWVRDEPDRVTGPVVARIILEVGAGRPYLHIAADLTADGIPTPTGKSAAWHPASVVVIAGNAAYGNLVATLAREQRAPLATADGRVITEEDCAHARARVDRSKRTGERPARQTHRYSGCLHCKACDGPIVGYTATNGRARYRCKHGCMSIEAADVDRILDLVAIARLSQPDLVHLATMGTDRTAATEARKEADRLQQELDQFAAEAVSARAYKIREDATLPKIRAALQRAQEAETSSQLRGLPHPDKAIVRARWDALETSARRAAFTAMYPRALLLPGYGTGSHVPAEKRLLPDPDFAGFPGEE